MLLSLKSYRSHTCLLSVMALGWHLVQIPSGQGGWPSQPDLILQLMFSKAANFPLQEIKTMLDFRQEKFKQKKWKNNFLLIGSTGQLAKVCVE